MSEAPLDFAKDVVEKSHETPVLVDFWAPWCGPCRMLGPILEKMAQENGGAWQLVKINTEEHQEIAMQFQVSSIPDVRLFHNGEIIGEFKGALPEAQILAWLGEHLPSPAKEMLSEAMQMLSSGQEDEAIALLKEAVAADPGLKEAKFALGKALIFSDSGTAIESLQAIKLGDPLHSQAESLIALAQFLSEDVDSLPEDPAKARYVQGVSALKNKQYEEALQHFVESARENKGFHEQAARKACVAVFHFLGEDNPLTGDYRRKLSLVLY